jgi:hypothetical protein
VARTCIFWDEIEDNIVEEYDEAGVTLADYTTERDHFGNVISQRRNGDSSFFHFGDLGSTLAVTDESQNVTDTPCLHGIRGNYRERRQRCVPIPVRGAEGLLSQPRRRALLG